MVAWPLPAERRRRFGLEPSLTEVQALELFNLESLCSLVGFLTGGFATLDTYVFLLVGFGAVTRRLPSRVRPRVGPPGGDPVPRGFLQGVVVRRHMDGADTFFLVVVLLTFALILLGLVISLL